MQDMENIHYVEAFKLMQLDNPDLEKAFRLLEQARSEGFAPAIYAVATWYLHGRFVDENIGYATKLLKQAAKLHDPDALFDLAISYEKGIGVKKSDKKAFFAYLESALYGDKQSFFEVGRCYFYGIGVSQDRIAAKIWLKKAKNLGIVD